MRRIEPTSGKNAASRLFLRFLICYIASIPIALSLAPFRHALNDAVGETELFFIFLCCFSGLLTVTKPFLILLTLSKACFDLSLLRRVLLLARGGAVPLLPFNAFLCYLLASVILFLITASRAALFTFRYTARDTKLLFSRPFLLYLLEMSCFLASGMIFYLLWPQILQLISVKI